ncbi:hypothetical protein SETIT_1G060400v2 [Setaria italica]|uniref:Uncharacterized protein n=2 Tax=Setaria italica TaxID=4555 RepID=A0A368PIA9_SETIT|nr:hypothetical protein SETIT_1G060400v2 [Setaria italica]
MAMLLRRSGLGGLRRRSAAPLSASRKAMVPPSLGVTFLASSSGAGVASRIKGTPIRSIIQILAVMILVSCFIYHSSMLVSSYCASTLIYLQFHGHRHYGNAFNGTESAKESSKKKPFVEKVKVLTKELLERYWAPLRPGEKLIVSSTIGYCGFLLEMVHTTEKQKL